jgi:hypothetical protein
VPFQDWGSRERLSEIARSYAAADHRVRFLEYRVPFGFTTLAGLTQIPIRYQQQQECSWVWMATAIFPHVEKPNGIDPDSPRQLMAKIEIGKNRKALGFQRRVVDPAGAGVWTPIYNIAGRGRMPFVWPFPLFLEAGDLLTVTFWNQGAGELTETSITAIGVSLYPLDSENAA